MHRQTSCDQLQIHAPSLAEYLCEGMDTRVCEFVKVVRACLV